MTDKKKEAEKREKNPDETLDGSVAAHLVIKDTKTGNVIINTRG
jgi:hypothetical protein